MEIPGDFDNAEELLRSLPARMEELDSLADKYRASGEAGRIALVAAHPFLPEQLIYQDYQSSVTEAKRSAPGNEGRLYIQ